MKPLQDARVAYILRGRPRKVEMRSYFPLELAAQIEAERRLYARVPSTAEVIRQLCSEAMAIRRIGRSKPQRGAPVPFTGLTEKPLAPMPLRCPLCGYAHRAGEVCGRDSAPLVLTAPVVLTEPAPVVLTRGVNKQSSEERRPDMRKNDRHKPGYMRDYMRKRRQKKT